MALFHMPLLHMTWLQIVLLVASGFVAGIVNAVAGGGTFFTVAAMVFAGVPTLDANATSSVALTPGNFASALGYREDIRPRWRRILPFAIIGAIGAVIGVWLLVRIGDAGFRPMVPWLLLLATVLFAFSRKIRALTAPLAHENGIVGVAAYAIMGVVAVYGGFFGAGMGIMMLAALAVIESGDFHQANAIKNLVALLIQSISALLFILNGLVSWPHALITMTASVLGGYLGIRVARHVPEKIIRAAVVTVGAALTVLFFLR
jgi:uncharacterized membrane protein YfcA